jgi:hypothetical protein
MKKIMMSAVALTAIMGSMNTVSASEKGIDIKTTGQAVVYYNTAAANGTTKQSLFSARNDANTNTQDNTRANFGIQLNLDANLQNGFTFGSQINYLGTLGLEKNLVNNVMQTTNGTVAENNVADDIYLSKLYIAKQLGNTTLKLGRQELPKSLSPFAFSEGWNVFKNTFDAIVAVNTDIPGTTLVGAYVAKSNHNGFGNNMSSFTDLNANVTGLGTLPVAGSAYMLTVANKSIPMTAITASYYNVNQVDTGLIISPAGDTLNLNTEIFWGDVTLASKDLPLGLKVGVQGGKILPEKLKNTNAYGAKIGLAPVKGLSVCAAYSFVDNGAVHVRNSGGVKTPLYTQLIANQGAIQSDNTTYMLKAAYNAGDFGKIILQGSKSEDHATQRHLTDAELVYKIKAGGVNFLAAYIKQHWSKKNAGAVNGQDIVRVVARYNF